MNEDDEYILSDNHYDQAMLQLADLQEQNELCDVTLVGSDGQEVRAHKIVLAARIPYFRARFSSGLFGRDEITFNTIPLSVLQKLIQYVYKGKIQCACWEEVCDILVAADYLQLDTLKLQCEMILKRELCLENCIELCNISNVYNCNYLMVPAVDFAALHWAHVTTHQTWLKINMTTLQQLILMDKLNASNEEDVLSAVMSWVKYDKCRESHLSSLLTEVRLPLLSSSTLETLERNAIVVNSKSCQRLITEARTLSEIVNSELGQGNKRKRCKLRERAYYGNSIYVFGGYPKTSEGDYNGDMEVYSALYCEWSTRHDMSPNIDGAGVTVVDNVIYVVGGLNVTICGDGADNFPVFSSFDPSRQKWRSEGPLPVKIDITAATFLKDRLIMAGGQIMNKGPFKNGRNPVSSAYLYNTVIKEWRQVCDLMNARLYHRMTTLHDKVYTVGGAGDSASIRIPENEVYDVNVDEWNVICKMKEPRNNMALVATDSRLVAIGGFSTESLCDTYTTEYYDPRVGLWEACVEMPLHSSGMSASVLRDEIYMMGGQTIDAPVHQLFILDQRMERWRNGPDLALSRDPCYSCTIP